ncbi:MAG: TldD/PmbA family protein [Actinobacteria bacterium]|nr:TldD/PmbA family protein [Actinomycetota bacterium]
MLKSVDSDFLALPLTPVADAAITTAKSAGASHVDIRIERVRTGLLNLRDAKPETQADDTISGVGVRVIVDGAWGFASSPEISVDKARELALTAVAMAKTSGPLSTEEVSLATEPVYANKSWVSAYEIDPFSVPDGEKIDRLADLSNRLLKSVSVNHATASCMYVKEQKHYADGYGTSTTQQRVRIQTQIDAISVGAHGFESMRTLAQPAGFGWEWMSGKFWDWDGEIAELPGLLNEKVKSPSVEAGKYDLVIHPSNLWLTIHESIGHATELDRAIGYEANYAGTSFATPDKLNNLQYGSKLMNVTGDRLTDHGLSTVGWDDEGVAAQKWEIIKDGLLVGYQLDRRISARVGRDRSNGCAFADSPAHVPIQRMPNVSLQADPNGPDLDGLISSVDDGILIKGDKSWSIDMQRYNFQFTGQQFHRIKNGKIVGQLKDVAYQSKTTDFWNSMKVVGGPSTYVLGGAFNCGKGQPGQVAAVSHGCPAALFEQVNILNTVAEAGK